MNTETAAKDMSGPKVLMTKPGNNKAQYIVPDVCGRKKAGPVANASMLPMRI